MTALLWVLASEKFKDGKQMVSEIEKLAASFMPADWIGQPSETQEPIAQDQLSEVAQVMERAFGKR